LLLLTITGLAQILTFAAGRLVRVRSEQIQARPLPALANVTHELRTPVSLIVGFCETLLSPARAHRERDSDPLPAAYRSDIEAIYRNATYLQKAVEDVLDILKGRTAGQQSAPGQPIRHVRTQVEKPVPPASSEEASSAPDKSIIVLDEDPLVAELFRSNMSRFDVIGATDIREIESLTTGTQLAAVIVSSEETQPLIPEIPHVVGEEVPIFSCSARSEQQPAQGQAKTTFLIKPITFQALADALERVGSPIQNILIIDDNRDNVEMISRMIGSMPDQPRLWKTYSGREGLALMYEQPMDVVIVDLQLPDMDGANLTQYIRADPRLSTIPILIVSAYHELAIASPPPILGKITILRFAGFQPAELARYIESFTAVFSTSP
jgi:CheY-like chemotaxis protein